MGVSKGLVYKRMGYEIRKVNGFEKLKFKYLLEDGMCEKSFALNVAQLAGISMDIVKRAEFVSEDLREVHTF